LSITPVQEIRPRRGRRVAVVAALTLAGLAAGAGIASAHVTVTPSEASQGGYATLTFRVPNEEPSASTTKITITIPEATPLASVRYMNVPGWTAEAVTTDLKAPVTSGNTTLTKAITSVTFTAQAGNGIGAGQFAEFSLSVGPLPQIDSISFPTKQTYDDGTVVDWNEPMPPGAEEPEHPAPTLTLTAGGDDHGAATTTAAAAVTTGPSVTADPQSAAAVEKSDSAARILGVVGIVVGAAGLLVGAIGLRRRAPRA
jgi:periplasmic copper chaperone A